MNRVALYHANDELADRLVEGVDRYADGWAAERVESRVDTLAHIRALDCAHQCMHERFDVIQVDTLVNPGPPAQLASWLSGTPVVGYFRGWGDYTNYHGQYGWRKRARIRAKTRLQCRTMDGLAGISSALVAGMSNMYPMANTEVIERPYDVAHFAGGEDIGLPGDVILTVTNLRYAEKRDGVLDMIEGLKPLLKFMPRASYHIAGGGRHLDAVREAADGHEQINVLGHVDNVPDLLASADVFVYASYLDGAPSTVYEAQAAGLPVIGADAAGVPEAVGDAGIICPPSPAGIREAVEAVLTDDAYRDSLAQASRLKMAEHNERVIQDWVSFWEAQL